VSLRLLLASLAGMERHDLLKRIAWQDCIEEMKREDQKVPVRAGLEGSAPPPRGQGRPPSRSYACSILLMFAGDAREFALRLCADLRRGRDSRLRIGVLVLSEQRHLLDCDPTLLLLKWAGQVSLVVPVLSPRLLRQIMSWQTADQAPADDPEEVEEALHNRYLFRVLLDQYLARGSLNTRCRPVCPDAFAQEVCSHELVRSHGLLQAVFLCRDYPEAPQAAQGSPTAPPVAQGTPTALPAAQGSQLEPPAAPDTLSAEEAPPAANASVETFAELLIRSAEANAA